MTCDFCKSDSNTMPSCPLKPHSKHHINWHRWRAIIDRIVSHPGYRYDDPRKWTLLRLANFASIQLALYNNRQWQTRDVTASFTGRYDGHTGFDHAPRFYVPASY